MTVRSADRQALWSLSSALQGHFFVFEVMECGSFLPLFYRNTLLRSAPICVCSLFTDIQIAFL